MLFGLWIASLVVRGLGWVTVVFPLRTAALVGRGSLWAVSGGAGIASAGAGPLVLLAGVLAVVWVFGPSGEEQRAEAAAEHEATRTLHPNELCLDDTGPEPRTEPCEPGVFRPSVTDKYCDEPFAFIGTDVDPRYADTYYHWCSTLDDNPYARTY